MSEPVNLPATADELLQLVQHELEYFEEVGPAGGGLSQSLAKAIIVDILPKLFAMCAAGDMPSAWKEPEPTWETRAVEALHAAYQDLYFSTEDVSLGTRGLMASVLYHHGLLDERGLNPR